ncbi:glycerophosphodiester phosphodiesterase [Candidatus Phycosocius bacilliformis]|uniref:Glycerophosphodiester phosphodiesterase n=1 Tax=Candidatus Phycosocius bacilliformis TaxID=1445552 RepID=A0A2P2ECG1_9PROT|nr:glycerophosphodiester phosphodiesterase family protein [Candidatus Phycosocius bacilliformis]GBF58745.1 glycerophosphodiester phosphodiesterase [Candidatus Phycosocius bacilliformis]
MGRKNGQGLSLSLSAAVAIAAWSFSLAHAQTPSAHPILAHRGVHQTYSRENLGRDDCTATRINPPTHTLIENTLPSLAATVALGADMIEIDVHPTTDGDFAVFHDWTLECRTNGHGVTRYHDMAYLRSLDAGYGYSADEGATFPLRGKGVGLIPNLDEVLTAVPKTRLLINIKSRDPEEGRKLAAYLAARQIGPDRVMVYGHEVPVEAFVKAAGPGFIAFSKKQVADCLKGYVSLGWSGTIPQACHNTLVLVPISHTHLMWGWDRDFAARMATIGSLVLVTGPIPKGANSQLAGLNDPELLKDLPAGVGVWTDAVEQIAPALARRQKK